VNDSRTHVGPVEVARRLGVSAEHVGDLIRAGLLRASNVGLGRRAQWRVAIADLEAFLVARTNLAESASGTGGRKQATRRGVGRGAGCGGAGRGGRRSQLTGEEFV
jgi:excisionase family DNA binding protein